MAIPDYEGNWPPEGIKSQTIGPGKANFAKEARRIQRLARRGDTRVVKLGPIIFFCANEDAWMLDPEHHYARCLGTEGESFALGIVEDRANLLIAWTADYKIAGDVFTVMERGRSSPRSFIGYPTRMIQQFSEQS